MVNLLLTGTYFRQLDEKQRLTIPKPMREALGVSRCNVLYLAPGTDGSVALYTAGAYEELANQLGQNSPTGSGVRAFSRLFYAQSQQVEVDRHGRLRLPAALASLAELQGEVVLLGVRDHLEIWDRGRWEKYLAELQPQYDEIAESAFGGPVSTPADNAQDRYANVTNRPP